MEHSLTPPPARIVVSASPGEVRTAVLAPKLTEYRVWHPDFPDRVGDIYLGHVADIRPDMGGRFVALPDSMGFLPDSACDAPAPGLGMGVVVRVTRAAQGQEQGGASGKGVRLTARLAQAEAACWAGAQGTARRLTPGPDPVVDLAAAWPQAEIVTDAPGLVAGWQALLTGRVRLVRQAMEPSLLDLLARLEAPVWHLPGGGALHVSPTPALTAIDVDMGRAAEAGGKTSAQARFNTALLPELARQIRLRNLGGAILVDFAGMTARQRPKLAAGLRTALAEDRMAARLVGFTGLGFAEIVRRRGHAPLHEVLASPPARLAAAIREARAACLPGQPAILGLGTDLMAALDRAAGLYAALAGDIRVVMDAGLAATAWEVRTAT